ncbi:dethiobiotin synthase [Oxalobacteraceae bacterium CAVE-383]|nr:dethiobiotin synthase [Oxalobacteraceae bacterium CAVE-383]
MTNPQAPFQHYFIAGTDTEIGKTMISCALLLALARHGARAAGMKPVAAGAELHVGDGAWHNEDVDLLAAHSNFRAPPELANPYLFRQPIAPHIAAALEGRSIEIPHILDCYRRLAGMADAVVVEGVGGFRVPFDARHDSADLARQLGLPVIMVVGLRLGCISQALLSAEAIAARGLRLAGWVANHAGAAEMPFADENCATLIDRLDAPLLGRVPHLAPAQAASALPYLDFSSLLPPLLPPSAAISPSSNLQQE